MISVLLEEAQMNRLFSEKDLMFLFTEPKDPESTAFFIDQLRDDTQVNDLHK